MNIKRAIFMVVLVLAVAALAVPLVGLRASASGSVATPKTVGTPRAAAVGGGAVTAPAQELGQGVQREVTGGSASGEVGTAGTISGDTLKALGITRVADPAGASARMAQKLKGNKK